MGGIFVAPDKRDQVGCTQTRRGEETILLCDILTKQQQADPVVFISAMTVGNHVSVDRFTSQDVSALLL